MPARAISAAPGSPAGWTRWPMARTGRTARPAPTRGCWRRTTRSCSSRPLALGCAIAPPARPGHDPRRGADRRGADPGRGLGGAGGPHHHPGRDRAATGMATLRAEISAMERHTAAGVAGAMRRPAPVLPWALACCCLAAAPAPAAVLDEFEVFDGRITEPRGV